MKILTVLLISACSLFSTGLLAHPGGHGEMRLEIGDTQALDIVKSMTRALTFKDRGYEAGKLDVSWLDVTKEEYQLVEESDSVFIFKAKNSKNDQTLFFTINKNGRVQTIKDASGFSKGHGHKH